ncbi:MAG: anthranilate synthase component I family protein [Myxococcales bacterium]|nr:anthranilate synthase component I family protein [Myxococcales bacterium]
MDVDGGGGGGGDDGGQGQGQGQGDVLLFDPPRWIGLLAYDALWAGALDGRSPRVGSRHAHERAVMRFGRYDALIGVDHVQGRAWVVADDEAAARRLRVALDAPCPAPSARVEALEVTDAEAHVRAIEEARAAIARGELYQVNLARRWRGRFEGAPLALALAMREASPVPFGFFLHEGERAWIARSMERFLAWSPDARGRGVLETRPIKGTVPRDPDDRDDAVDRLRADPKELAEHAMIVDLLRNDLARVAETGSVEVVAPMVVEAYAKLHHLVSTVRCTTREGTRLRHVLAATFPPGSVTGAPKAAAVALIDALEPFARGSYCGAHGYVSRRGALSLSVSIRTAEIEDDEVSYFAGGGIVWPSDARREVAETELKARVFLDAVEALARSAG